MIEIYKTLIDEREVVGVGALMAKRSADPTIFQLYNERMFYFDVYTAGGGCVHITTDWLPFKEPHTEYSKLVQSAITEAHKALRRCLIDNAFSQLQIYKEHEAEQG